MDKRAIKFATAAANRARLRARKRLAKELEKSSSAKAFLKTANNPPPALFEDEATAESLFELILNANLHARLK